MAVATNTKPRSSNPRTILAFDRMTHLLMNVEIPVDLDPLTPTAATTVPK
jgi:hypothetical protein